MRLASRWRPRPTSRPSGSRLCTTPSRPRFATPPSSRPQRRRVSRSIRSPACNCKRPCNESSPRQKTSPNAPKRSSPNSRRATVMGYQPASRALAGLTVLDLTHARAGPVCVRQLADWGADVIKIERPGNPEDFAGRHEADFQNKHRNKRSLALNLRSEEGRAILYRMVTRADVAVENFRPDVKT